MVIYTIKNNNKFACTVEEEKIITFKKSTPLEDLKKNVQDLMETICWMLLDKIEDGDINVKKQRNNEWTGV